MSRFLVLALALAIAGSVARADSPSTEPAARAWAITDLVLARHIDPPTRQQMLLAGLKALTTAGQVPAPTGLARRVSDLSTPDQFAAILAEVWPAASKDVDPEKLEDSFFDGLLSVVPGGATLMSAKERNVTESMNANMYVGIQVALGADRTTKKPIFHQILEGGPAEEAGARANDVIDEIEGVSTEGMPLGKVVDRLRGELGSQVLVKFRRPETGEVFTKAMTRSMLPRPSIQGLSPLPGKRWKVRLDSPLPIGYLKITEVSGSTPSELRAFAEQMESEGIKALVLDLSEIQGGAPFHTTVLLADALLDGGIIGRVKSVDGEKTIRAEPDSLFRGWPIYVIDGTQNGGVAWLCDALSDNHRATIAGNLFTIDDALVQESVSLPGGDWSIQLATGRLERGDGQPLTTMSRKPGEEESPGDAEPSDKGNPTQYTSTLVAPGGPVRGVDFRRIGGRKRSLDRELARAREVLGKALNAAGN